MTARACLSVEQPWNKTISLLSLQRKSDGCPAGCWSGQLCSGPVFRERQHDMGGHLADDMGIVADARSAGIGGPSVGFGGSARGKVTGNKGMQAVCRVVGDLAETDAAGAGTAVRDLDGADGSLP